MYDVSILISSLNECNNIVNLINSYNNNNLLYEIIVCSDSTSRDLSNVKYIPDPNTSVKAFNDAYRCSNGKFILIFPGTVLPPPNMFDIIEYLDGLKYKISSFSDDFGASCFVPDWSSYLFGLNYRPQILRFPCFHRDFIENYLDGVIFNESFKHHWVDNWLSIFCGQYFHNISENTQFRIKTIPHVSMSKHDDHDLDVFKKLLEAKKNYNYRVKLK